MHCKMLSCRQFIKFANRTLPQWLLPNLSADELRSCSRPDAICILPVGTKNDHQRDIQDVHPSRWDVHLIEVKYCDDTRPEQQLARATEQHNGLKHALAQQCHKVSLHTILIGVMGTIYKYHTDLLLSKLGLDRCRVRKLTQEFLRHTRGSGTWTGSKPLLLQALLQQDVQSAEAALAWLNYSGVNSVMH